MMSQMDLYGTVLSVNAQKELGGQFIQQMQIVSFLFISGSKSSQPRMQHIRRTNSQEYCLQHLQVAKGSVYHKVAQKTNTHTYNMRTDITYTMIMDYDSL